MLPVPADFADRMAALARVVTPIGPEIYDLAIAVTALAAGITDIYTYDTSVFGRVPGVTVKAP